MRKLLVGILCGLVSLPTFADDMWYLAGGNEKEAMAIDASTIETNGNIKGTWVLMVRAETELGFDYTFSWWDIDCKVRKVRATESGIYDIDGQKYQPLPIFNWQRVPPGTLAADVHKAVCKGPTTKVGSFNHPSDVAKEIRARSRKMGYWK